MPVISLDSQSARRDRQRYCPNFPSFVRKAAESRQDLFQNLKNFWNFALLRSTPGATISSPYARGVGQGLGELTDPYLVMSGGDVMVDARQSYWERILKTAWQAAVASLSVAQITGAITGGLNAWKQIVMVASGAAVAAVVSFLKNVAWKPTASGPLGIFERFVSTFVQGAFATVPVNILSNYWGDHNLHAVQAVGMTALGAGVAAVLSLMQNLSGAASGGPAADAAGAAAGALPNQSGPPVVSGQQAPA